MRREGTKLRGCLSQHPVIGQDLSLSSLFNSAGNAEVCQVPQIIWQTLANHTAIMDQNIVAWQAEKQIPVNVWSASRPTIEDLRHACCWSTCLWLYNAIHDSR